MTIVFLVGLGAFFCCLSWRFPAAGVMLALNIYVLRTAWARTEIAYSAELGLILTLLLLGISGFRFACNSFSIKLVLEDVLLACFLLYALISCFWTNDVLSGGEKWLRLSISGAGFYLVGRLWMSENPESQEDKVKHFVVTAVLVSILLLGLGLRSPLFVKDRLSIGVTNVIPVGLLLVWSMFFGGKEILRSRGWKQVGAIFLTTLLLVGLISLNTKGPVIALGICALPVFLLVYPKSSSRIGLICIILLVLLACLVAFTAIGQTLFERFCGLAQATSTKLRIELFSEAFENWSQAPILGKGLGSFLLSLEQSPGVFKDFIYPHNIFLEVAGELGIVGLTIAGAFLILVGFRAFIALRFSSLAADRSLLFLALGGFSIAFIIGMVSMSISMLKSLFFCAGLLVGAGIHVRSDGERALFKKLQIGQWNRPQKQ